MHTYVYSCFYAYSLSCIFITVHIHYYAYSLSCIFITVHIHYYAYSLPCIFIIMHIHLHTYSYLYTFSHLYAYLHPDNALSYISCYPSYSRGETQTDTHSYTVTSICLQKILQDRIMVVRDYRLSVILQ